MAKNTVLIYFECVSMGEKPLGFVVKIGVFSLLWGGNLVTRCFFN